MPARFVIMLKKPPASPNMFLGARSVSTVQPRFDMPCPKKATDMMAITRPSRPSGTQLASTSDEAIMSPDTTGSFRAKLIEPPRLMIVSAAAPPTRPPTAAAMNGNDRKKPSLIHAM